MTKELETEKIKENPYQYVQDWMEGVLMHVGKRTFSVLSLVPCSLILPDLPFGSSKIRSNINVLVLAPPSSGKSTLCKKFSNITYYPLERKKISAPELSQKAVEMFMLSLIIEDFSQIAQDYEVVKVIEGIIGDEKNVNRSNMRTEVTGETEAVSLMCGTPSDLVRYIQAMEGGLFFRFVIVLISHTVKQHSEIGEYINNNIGSENFSEKIKIMEETVIDYYQKLKLIQESQNKKINAIKGYSINEKIKKDIFLEWDTITRELVKDCDFYWTRELHEAYRFLVAHAFLNIHNREHKNGILVPNEEDYKVALRLMKQNMRYKWAIIKSTALNKKIKSADTLRLILNSSIPEPVKNILLNISPYSAALKVNKNMQYE